MRALAVLVFFATVAQLAVATFVPELGEWYTFIRHGTELATAYQDTLGDEVLGTLGAFVGAVVVSRGVGKGAGTTHRPVR